MERIFPTFLSAKSSSAGMGEAFAFALVRLKNAWRFALAYFALAYLALAYVVFSVLFLVFLVLLGPGLGSAHASKLSSALGGKSNEEPVKASLHADLSLDPGSQRLWIALRLQHAPGWHSYWVNPGDSGLATGVEWTLPEGWIAPKPYWPMPERIAVGPLMNFGYEGDLWVPLALDLPIDVKQGIYPIKAQVRWLMCSDVCIPGEAALALELRLPGAKLPAIREALSRVPQHTITMGYRREGDKIRLVPASSDDAGKIRIPSGRESTVAVTYFPEHAGWMMNAARQVIEADPANGWALLLDADKSFQDRPAIEGYLRLDKNSYRVVATNALSSPGPGSAAEPVSLTGQGKNAALANEQKADRLIEQAAPVDQSLIILLVSALIGGLLLNAMPCVFPVIGLKLLSLVPATQKPEALDAEPASIGGSALVPGSFIARDDVAIEQGVRKASLLYGFGVLLSFWALGLIVVMLQAGGEQIGWGFQLQEPGFVFAMFMLFLLIGANLLGIFEVGSSFTTWAGSAEFGALGSGVLAVLVATPCTAPFMGAALGASLSRGPMEAMAVFTALALGMALPYGALVLRPQWIHRLPRPGPWMVWTRKALAFPMFFAAVWLAWVFVLQTDQGSVLRLGFSAVCLFSACWLYGERVQPGWMLSQPRTWSATLSFALLLLSLFMPFQGGFALKQTGLDAVPTSALPEAGKAWMPWSPEAVEQALQTDAIVFIDFTAAWCVSCQVNKQLVLSSEAVNELFASQKVHRFRGDWTKQDPRITATLAQYGRRGVPLYLVLRRGRSPQVLPEVLSYGLVRDAVLGAAAS